MFGFLGIHRHKYKIVAISVRHHYNFFDSAFLSGIKEVHVPEPLVLEQDAANCLESYWITSTVNFMCEGCGRVKDEYRNGDWSHLVHEEDHNA